MKPASFTPEELFQHARPNGVRRVTLIQMSFYGYDNSYMLDSMKKHPGVFSGVAVIDENDRPAERMVELHEVGVRGFRIEGCHVQRWGDGGSAIDMVGCQKGAITRCKFSDAIGDAANGVQTKGGSSDIVIQFCRFENAGGRAVNAIGVWPPTVF